MDPSPTPPPLVRAAAAVGLVFFVVATLYLAAGVLVPVVEALVVWFVLNAMANGVRRLPVVGEHVPRSVALVVSALVSLRDRLPDRAELDPHRLRLRAPGSRAFATR